jgi:membrane-associated protease RseP (regulator of RpoE activity)
MKKYFAQLRPMERRLVVGVAVVLVLVLNAVFIWPHFADWGNLRHRLDAAHTKLTTYKQMIAQIPALTADVKKFESEGEFVAPEDQGINFMRTIQAQSAQSGVAIINTSRQITHTNDAFFVEQVENINVLATEDQLVDFLYKLGSGASMIRVRDLELQPDPPRQRLNANIRLVASYTKSPPPADKNSTAKAK